MLKFCYFVKEPIICDSSKPCLKKYCKKLACITLIFTNSAKDVCNPSFVSQSRKIIVIALITNPLQDTFDSMTIKTTDHICLYENLFWAFFGCLTSFIY